MEKFQIDYIYIMKYKFMVMYYLGEISNLYFIVKMNFNKEINLKCQKCQNNLGKNLMLRLYLLNELENIDLNLNYLIFNI